MGVIIDLGGKPIAEAQLRAMVALMRELGVVVAFGITLGPEPRPPTRIEVLEKKAVVEDTPEARMLARVENAREEIRARLGQWDLSAEQCDRMLDPSLFELG
jgi:hypothetical protein